MTRDGYNGSTSTTVTQTRTFDYAGLPGTRVLTKTTFPENGVTDYMYSGKLLAWKKNRNGVWKYLYDGTQRLTQVLKYPGATNGENPNTPEDVNRRATYYYDAHPFQTDFVTEFPAGRLVAIAYRVRAPSSAGGFLWEDVKEFYSYTRGGRLKKKRLDLGNAKLDVAFEYDSKGKLEFMVYPSGKRVKYTYDDLARHTGMKQVLPSGDEDIATAAYGVAGQMTNMSWKVSGVQWAGQSWEFNNRLQMMRYQLYEPPPGPNQPAQVVDHKYIYTTTKTTANCSSDETRFPVRSLSTATTHYTG
jgi:hypothetical protein